MPNVSPYELSGNNGSGWVAPTSVSGYDGSWKNGFAVYYHNGTTWVEVWNARPQMVSTSMATTSSTGLTFTGTADPNNFATTAKFEYKEVGAGSYSNSGTTTTGLGNGVDGAVSYTVTATVSSGDTWKNWEARASGTNAGGTGTGSTITLDCRKHNASGSGWTETPSYDSSGCDGCGTKTLLTYTKSGCQQYNTGYGACSGSWTTVEPSFQCVPVSNGTYPYVYGSVFGWLYYTTSNCESGSVSTYCGYSELRGPGGVQYCSVSGSYRVTGSDQCNQVGI